MKSSIGRQNNFRLLIQILILYSINMKSENIKVVVRIRPMNDNQTKSKQQICLSTSLNQIKIFNNGFLKQFIFDEVFAQTTTQEQLYQSLGYGFVESVAQGYYTTILTYGQTGSGKTYTMSGINNQNKQGIMIRAFNHLLSITETEQKQKFILKMSFLEIYNEIIKDLLADTDEKYILKQSPDRGFYVKNLSVLPIKNFHQFQTQYYSALQKRSVFSTKMNSQSSRSHTVLTFYLEILQQLGGKNSFKQGKINLVDLAGSERQKKTQSTGQRLKQAIKINLSLIALSNVINALVDGKKNAHIPYRDSILTKILQDSFGGKTKTILIANISPTSYNYDQTLSTLRYASRASLIKNNPVIHIDPKDMLIKQYLEEIQRLKNSNQKKREVNIEYERLKIQNELQARFKSEIQKRIDEKNAIINQKNHIDFVLKEEKKNNELLLKKLKEFQEMLINNNEIQEEEKKIKVKKRKQLYDRYKKKEELIFNNKRKIQIEEDQLETETQNKYKNPQQQISRLKKINQRLRQRHKIQKAEIKDLHYQFEIEREGYLETIRELEKDYIFFNSICQKFMSDDEIEIIRINSQYEEDKRRYKLVPFLLKKGKVHFPKLNEYQVNDLISHQKMERKLELLDSKGFTIHQDQKKTKKGFDKRASNIFTEYDKNYEQEATGLIKANSQQYLMAPNVHISQKILKNYENKAQKLSADSRKSAKNLQVIQNRFKKFNSPISRGPSTPTLRKLEPLKLAESKH